MAIEYSYKATSTSITCTLSGWGSEIVESRKFEWYLDGKLMKDTGWIDAVSSYSYTFTGLKPGVTYSIYARSWTPNGWNNTYTFDDITTPAYTLTMSTIATSSSIVITARISSIQSDDVPLIFYLKERSASTWRKKSSKSIEAGSLTESCTFTTDITPATVYHCYVEDALTGMTAPSNADGYSTKRTNNNFSWTGGPKVSGNPFDLTASDWNEFTSQLRSKEIYFTDDNRSFTTAVKGNDFTAAMCNEAIKSINNLVDSNATGCVTRLSEITKGSPVKASLLNDLVKCLNE